jgi:cystathionine beta-lyase
VDSVYRPARRFCDNVLNRLGVTITYYDPRIGADIARLITKKTKVVFTESPGSQTFEVQDVPAIAKAGHAAGAVVILDNTWATPLYFKPFAHGADVPSGQRRNISAGCGHHAGRHHHERAKLGGDRQDA